MAVYTLDEFRADMDAKFGDLIFDCGEAGRFTLGKYANLTGKDRDAVKKLRRELQEKQRDLLESDETVPIDVEDLQEEYGRRILIAASGNDAAFKKWLDHQSMGAVGQLLDKWNEVTQPGEA